MRHAHTDGDLHLRKLGIREIQERLEVSPIIADPGSLGSGFGSDLGQVADGKHYECNIVKPDGDIPEEFERQG